MALVLLGAAVAGSAASASTPSATIVDPLRRAFRRMDRDRDNNVHMFHETWQNYSPSAVFEIVLQHGMQHSLLIMFVAKARPRHF